MQTETLDKLYLEWSQFTKAKNNREIKLEAVVEAAREVVKARKNMGDGNPIEGEYVNLVLADMQAHKALSKALGEVEK